MGSATERSKHSLPPWEYRQLTQVPYTTETCNTETHQRHGSRSTLPELKTGSTTHSDRLASLLKKSNVTESPTTYNAPAPYETQFDTAPRWQDGIDPKPAFTLATTTPAFSSTVKSLPGTISSSGTPVRSKRRARPQAQSVDESGKSGFASSFRGLFTSRSSLRSAQDCERLQQAHWSEDNY